MGLMPVQLGQRQRRTAAEVAQLNGGSTALFGDHRQVATTAAQGWILLTAIPEGASSPLGSGAHAASKAERHQADQQRAEEGAQSSKRELLSRGRELRGAGRLPPAPALGREDGPGPDSGAVGLPVAARGDAASDRGGWDWDAWRGLRALL